MIIFFVSRTFLLFSEPDATLESLLKQINKWKNYASNIKKRLRELSAKDDEIKAQLMENKKNIDIESNHLKAIEKRLAHLEEKFERKLNS